MIAKRSLANYRKQIQGTKIFISQSFVYKNELKSLLLIPTKMSFFTENSSFKVDHELCPKSTNFLITY